MHNLNIHLLFRSEKEHPEHSAKYLLFYSTKGKPYGFGIK